MPALNSAKHIVSEINGVRCSIIEQDASEERVAFLKDLLEFNKFDVRVAENPGESGDKKTFTIGVTNVVFHPVIAVYDRSLRTRTGERVSPAFWLQKSIISDGRYWRFGKGGQATSGC